MATKAQPPGLEDLDPEDRKDIEEGELAIERIDKAEDFRSWLTVGRGLIKLQTSAMRFAQSNQAIGARYAVAYGLLAQHFPHLAAIDKSTRSRAVWMATNAEAVIAWHRALPANVRRTLNHPNAVKRGYERAMAPTEAPRAAAAKRQDELVEAVEETDRLRGELVEAQRTITQLQGELDFEAGGYIKLADEPRAVIAAVLERRGLPYVKALIEAGLLTLRRKPRLAAALRNRAAAPEAASAA